MNLILSPTSFSDLKSNLEYCDELFLRHQVQLMHQNNEQALALFEKLVKIRMIHLDIMEEWLLPAFKEATNVIPEGARILYFEREKKQILKFLNKYLRRLGHLVLTSEKTDIVSLFEEYAWLKDLLDHHDAREKAFLFPLLDKNQPVDKQILLNKITIKLADLQEIVS